MRAELELRKKEAALLASWSAYEEGWRDLGRRVREGRGGLRWQDIPWPVNAPVREQEKEVKISLRLREPQQPDPEDVKLPIEPQHLTKAAISSFLLDPLTVRGSTTTKKERLRASMLRWHPDKLGSLLDLVEEEDRERVREGAREVFGCIQGLSNTAVKEGRA